MRRILASAATLLFGTGLLLSDGMSASIPGPLNVDGSMIQLAQAAGPKTKPVTTLKKTPWRVCGYKRPERELYLFH
jgi:hypothetical protein